MAKFKNGVDQEIFEDLIAKIKLEISKGKGIQEILKLWQLNPPSFRKKLTPEQKKEIKEAKSNYTRINHLNKKSCKTDYNY